MGLDSKLEGRGGLGGGGCQERARLNQVVASCQLTSRLVDQLNRGLGVYCGGP